MREKQAEPHFDVGPFSQMDGMTIQGIRGVILP